MVERRCSYDARLVPHTYNDIWKIAVAPTMGFDMIRPLSSACWDQGDWDRFMWDVEYKYTIFNAHARKQQGSQCQFLEFHFGTKPCLPYDGTKFVRFTSHAASVEDPGCTEDYVRDVFEMAQKHFGDRVQWFDSSNVTDDPRTSKGYYTDLDLIKSERGFDRHFFMDYCIHGFSKRLGRPSPTVDELCNLYASDLTPDEIRAERDRLDREFEAAEAVEEAAKTPTAPRDIEYESVFDSDDSESEYESEYESESELSEVSSAYSTKTYEGSNTSGHVQPEDDEVAQHGIAFQWNSRSTTSP